jgi:hypothetical protein
LRQTSRFWKRLDDAPSSSDKRKHNIVIWHVQKLISRWFRFQERARPTSPKQKGFVVGTSQDDTRGNIKLLRQEAKKSVRDESRLRDAPPSLG